MLKRICRLVLGLVVCTGSACVTPTHASSAPSVIMSHIQAAGSGGARDELIILHNNASVEVEVTNWCLKNKRLEKILCLSLPETNDVNNHEGDGSAENLPNTPTTRYFLPAYGDITVASEEHVAQSGYASEAFSFTYKVINQSSGSITGSADVMYLVDQNGEIVDEKSWLASLPNGKIWARVLLMNEPLTYANTGEASSWTLADQGVFVMSALRVFTEQSPPGDVDPPVEQPLIPLLITEIFANPAGSDVGNEFIELYNPSETDVVSLDGFRLRIGLDSAKWYALPSEVSLQPLQYLAIYNSKVKYTLVNTSGGVQLYRGDTPLGERVEYASPKDDYSWALIDTVWQYVVVATPNAKNVLLANNADANGAKEKTIAQQKPCAANQFRNPDTGRCKLIASASTTPTPCKEGQVRNAETNRCRNIATTKGPAPCKEGQERNPETNRCRNIVKMTNVDYGVKGATVEAGNQPSWYTIATIALIILGIASYAVWEWRQELNLAWKRIRRLFANLAG